MRKLLSIVLFIVFPVLLSAQHLIPGFDKDEFLEVIRINAQFSTSPERAKQVPMPEESVPLYKSEVMGLENLWQLWQREDGTVIISTRGTSGKGTSWLANLYAAQIPAKGTLKIDTDFVFAYDLAAHPKASV
ncbi:hypothetical protein [Sphingobacterium sp. LRF_L2]|uniref:hypothetical protein n=1 Tax=Sphingobacterium sp. LRF_L2 TaxID=3369421 RepID=UPI003F5F35C4